MGRREHGGEVGRVRRDGGEKVRREVREACKGEGREEEKREERVGVRK